MNFWKRKREATKVKEQSVRTDRRTPVFDESGKSQITGKTVKSVFRPAFDHELAIMAFTDGTYILIGVEVRGFPVPSQYVADPVDRGSLGSLIWSRTVNNADQKTIEREDAMFQELIEAGIYSQAEIDGMLEDGEATVKRQLNEQIANAEERIREAKTRLSRIG